MTTDTEAGRAVVLASTGEAVVLSAETEDLAAFKVRIDDLRAELADAEAAVLTELLRRLDRRGEWTMRVGDPKKVLYEIKAPSPTAGTKRVDADDLRARLLALTIADEIDRELARAALRRTVTIVAEVDVDADLVKLRDALRGMDAIAGTPVYDVAVDVAEAVRQDGVNRLKKAGHGSAVDAATRDVPAPTRKAAVKARAAKA